MINELWPGQVVTDWSLSKLVSDVRQLLGDSGKDQEYIKTIRGKGFKLNVSVQKLDTAPDISLNIQPVQKSDNSASLFSRALIAMIFVIAIGYFVITQNKKPAPATTDIYSGPRQVAVLPIFNSQNDTMNDWVKYGVMSLIAEQLNPYTNIQVIPVSTVISSLPTPLPSSPEEEHQLFEHVCGQIGCTDLISINYQIKNKLPTLDYRIINAGRTTISVEFSSPDVIDAAVLLIDELTVELLPSDHDGPEVELKYTSNNKANRDYAIGIHELLSGDIQSARNYLELAHNREPDFFWARAYLAEVEYRSGNLEKANNMVLELEKNQLTAEQSYFLQHLYSNILYSQGELEESLATTSALTTNEFALANPILMGNEYLNIGSSLQAMGNNQEAIVNLSLARDNYSKAGYGSGEGKVLFNLANVYLTNSNQEKAIETYQLAREVFIKFGLTSYALMAKHQIATTNLYLGKIQSAEGELRQLIQAYAEIGDTEGQLTAKVDLANVSLAKKNYSETVDLIDSLAAELQETELSYLINHALTLSIKAHLMLDNTEMAKSQFAKLKGGWTDIRAAFAFIPAHILHNEGDFEGAVAKGEALKTQLGTSWSPAHDEVLKQLEEAKNTGQKVKLTY